MKDVPLSRLIFSLFIAGILVLSGCSESEPELVSAKGYVVLDFSDEAKTPSVRLAAFAEVSSEVRRVDSIRIKNLATNLEWTCLNPAIFSNEKRQWSGYTEFLSPDGIEIPIGVYNFFYTDSQGKETSAAFVINYDEKLTGSTPEKVLSLLQESLAEQYALYSEKGTLLYFGAKKQNWTDDTKIFSFDTKTSYYRKIYTGTNNSVMCIMPPVYKETNSETNETNK